MQSEGLSVTLIEKDSVEKKDAIVVRGARQHNLKNVNVSIPRNKLVVITGVSGSGKSSLAFDTIFAEGQRRYVESLSAYARQFLGQLDKPDVDAIEGLSPAISIDQKSTSHNPRSTVGTVTEVYDYLRLLYARIGIPHCPKCGQRINPQTIDQIVDQVLGLDEGAKIQVLAPLIIGRKGEYQALFTDLRKEGFARVRIDGEVMQLEDEIKLDKNKKHTVDLVVDRLVVKAAIRSRLADSVSLALKWGKSNVLIEVLSEKRELLFSEQFACAICNLSFAEIAPRTFSFNSPYGACDACHGLGCTFEIDPDLVVPDARKTLNEGAIYPWSKTGNTYYDQILESVAKHYKFSLDVPFNKLSKAHRDVIFYGTNGENIKLVHDSFDGRETWEYRKPFEGVINNLKRRHEESNSDKVRADIENYMKEMFCASCSGARLKPEALAVKVGGISIAEFCAMPVSKSLAFTNALSARLTERERTIAKLVLKEVEARQRFLVDVGLNYLTLARKATTLSGGEAQRIRLATQIGSGLSGVLYVLDEPSIGLHQRDNHRLITTLQRLRDLGNTLIVVEHDEDTIAAADWIIDIGPGAGMHGGRLVAEGNLEDICASEESLTGSYLSGRRAIPIPKKRRAGNGKNLVVKKANINNLKDINVTIPLGKFVAVTGVSGSGKSSLVNDLLYAFLRNRIYGTVSSPTGIEDIEGWKELDKVIDIDQSPIGRTPRSNPATYTGLFDIIREVFSMTNEAKARGYLPGRFSFNVKGGRCEACRGEGMNEIEMNFLPSVFVNCEVCKGARYNRETLEVKFKGRSISDVLEMTVEEALEFFSSIPKAETKLQTLKDVGLDYVKLGQSATTLSGGEAQRVKLAEQLSKRSTGKTIYILDEPTTGLSFADVDKLLMVLNTLVDSGNTVLIIEHNLDVIKQADWIIDLGPEGGDGGGQLVAVGTPESLSNVAESFTGKYLKPYLEKGLKSYQEKEVKALPENGAKKSATEKGMKLSDESRSSSSEKGTKPSLEVPVKTLKASGEKGKVKVKAGR